MTYSTPLFLLTLLAGGPDEGRFTHVASASAALHEPYLALRTGLKCSACHTNVTGGGNRTPFGNVYAQTQLPLAPGGTVVRKVVTEFLSVGWDLRGEGVVVVEGDPDGAGVPRSAATLDVAQVYLAARFLEERLQLYIDQTVGPDRAVAREAFAMVRRLPLEGYAKAGKFLLPFGFRLQDDDEFIRLPVTGVSYFTPEQGLEVGVEPGPVSVSLAVTNGSVVESNSSKRVTSRAAVVLRDVRFGAAASLDERPGSARRELVGGFGGVRVGPLVLLGEADLVRDVTGVPDTDREQVVLYGEADWLVRRGVNLKLTHGWHDPDRDVDEDARTRSRFGVEVFPVPFLRLAAFYALLQDPENRDGASDLDRVSLEAQLHF